MRPIDIDRHVDELYERGFTALPALYNETECQEMRDALNGFWRTKGSPSLAGTDFGFGIHPLMPQVPALAPFLNRPEPIELLARAMRGKSRLTHLGARISGPQSADRIPWHHHYDWNIDGATGRDRIERVVAGIYVDGTGDDMGPLVVLPRRVGDPIGPARGGSCEAWPGEVHVELPPGSFAFLDSALWHAAKRGTRETARQLWGGHYQAWSDPRAHIEDNEVATPEALARASELPYLKTLLVDPGP